VRRERRDFGGPKLIPTPDEQAEEIRQRAEEKGDAAQWN
jgi:hypothetical protein